MRDSFPAFFPALEARLLDGLRNGINGDDGVPEKADAPGLETNVSATVVKALPTIHHAHNPPARLDP